jgi:hypothetical protein
VTFLNPLFLLGLLGMSVPLVIHLLSRRTARRVEFSSLDFLRNLERKSLRRLRVRQFLLLLLRMLLVAAVAIAMARPALTGGAGGGGEARTSAVLVLDASFSMTSTAGSAPLFAAAKERALSILETLKDGDEIVLLLPGATGGASPELGRDLEFVREQVAGASPGAAAADLSASLADAFRVLQSARHPNREVHVVTDFQRSAWDELKSGTAPEGIAVFLHPVSDEAPANAWVESVDFSGQILEPGSPIEFRVVIGCGAAHPQAAVDVELEVGGRVADRRRADLAPGSRVSVALRETFAADGLHTGAVVMRGASGPEDDDRRAFALRARASVPVLVVAGDDQVGRYLAAALAPPGAVAGSFAVHTGSPDALATASRSAQAVAVLADVERLSEGQLDGLKSYLSEGGGLLVFPGPHFDAAVWSRSFFPRFLPGSVSGVGATSAPLRLTDLDPSHPLFDLFRSGEGGLGEVRFERHLRIRTESGTRTLASFSNGDPAILESTLLPGRVILFASALEPTWSDLPLTGAFLPLLHECVRYLSEGQGESARDLEVGEAFTLRLPAAPAGGVTLVAPDGGTRAVAAEPGPGGYSVALPEATEPGFWVFVAGGGDTLGVAACHIAARESDFARIAPAEIEERLAERSVVLASRGDAGAAIEEARRGREIGRAFLWAAGLLLAAESIVARRGRARDEALA